MFADGQSSRKAWVMIFRVPRFWQTAVGLLVLAGLALLPWVRNRAYLRDFYDYGLFIKVNARLDAGQRPWVDFITPGQSASFLGNYIAEKLGGGTYLGMTNGGALLIVLSVVALALVLARRWPLVWAVTVAFAVAACSASQHTIVFYNSIGVLALAMVTWAFAIAPVLRRESAGWHLLAGCGLVLGGLNKINFHLLACGMAVGWLLWAWVQGRTNFGRMAAGFGFVAIAGGVMPVAIELAWSGADWRTWVYNVLQFPLQARGGRLALLADAKLYFSTLHDYYGVLRLPQAGAMVLGLPVVAGFFAWRSGAAAGWRRALFALGAGLGAGVGGALLLLTNNEIVYLTLAASLVLAVSIWLGFGLEPRGWRFGAALLVPAAIIAAAGWESAWLGQRSQFGHATDPRSEYVDGAQLGPELRYLAGTRVPPGLASSLKMAAEWRRQLPAETRDAIYFGPGLEWLERVWSSRMESGLPLVLAGFDSAREIESVRRSLAGPGGQSNFLVVEAWDNLPSPLTDLLRHRFEKERLGTSLFAYTRLPDHALAVRSVERFSEIDGNVDPALVATEMPPQQLVDGRRFRGIEGGAGRLDLLAASNRSTAEMVLMRAPGAARTGAVAQFRVHAVQGDSRFERWSAALTLPPDADELVVQTPPIDGSSLPLSFGVEAPPGLVAGWRALRLLDSVERDRTPPRVAPVSFTVRRAEDAFAARLLGDHLRGEEVWVRHGSLVDGACVIPPGGEVWIKLTGLYSRVDIVTRSAGEGEIEPNTRVLFYKGGRMERFYAAEGGLPGTRRYRTWSPENGGWLAIINLPGADASAVTLEIAGADRPAN